MLGAGVRGGISLRLVLVSVDCIGGGVWLRVVEVLKLGGGLGVGGPLLSCGRDVLRGSCPY